MGSESWKVGEVREQEAETRQRQLFTETSRMHVIERSENPRTRSSTSHSGMFVFWRSFDPFRSISALFSTSRGQTEPAVLFSA